MSKFRRDKTDNIVWEEIMGIIEKGAYPGRKKELAGHKINCSNEQCPCIVASQLVKAERLFLQFEKIGTVEKAMKIINEINVENLTVRVADCLTGVKLNTDRLLKVRELVKTFNAQVLLLDLEEE